jgi:hypothetical protein
MISKPHKAKIPAKKNCLFPVRNVVKATPTAWNFFLRRPFETAKKTKPMMRLVRDQDSSATAGIRKRLITAIAADYKTPDLPVIDSMKRLILVTSRKRWLQLTIILALVIPQLAFLPVQSLPTLIPWTLIHENHDASVSLAKHSLSEMSSYKLTETALKRPSQNNSSTCLVSPTESHDAEIPFGTPRFWIQIVRLKTMYSVDKY